MPRSNFLDNPLSQGDPGACKPPHFTPFGDGRKGCVGHLLAGVEMRAIMVEFGRLLEVLPLRQQHGRTQGTSLCKIPTRWDIANQPTSDVLVGVKLRQPGWAICSGTGPASGSTATVTFRTPRSAPTCRASGGDGGGVCAGTGVSTGNGSSSSTGSTGKAAVCDKLATAPAGTWKLEDDGLASNGEVLGPWVCAPTSPLSLAVHASTPAVHVAVLSAVTAHVATTGGAAGCPVSARHGVVRMLLLCGPHGSGKTTLFEGLLACQQLGGGRVAGGVTAQPRLTPGHTMTWVPIREVARGVMSEQGVTREQLATDETAFAQLQHGIAAAQITKELLAARHASQLAIKSADGSKGTVVPASGSSGGSSSCTIVSDRCVVDPLGYMAWRFGPSSTQVCAVEHATVYLFVHAVLAALKDHGAEKRQQEVVNRWGRGSGSGTVR